MDWADQGLLDSLEGDARDARVRLLDALHDDGVEVAELYAAVAEDRLVLLPIERALLPAARYTLAELVQRSGLSEDRAALRLRTLGLPVPEEADVAAFGDEEVEAVKRARAYTDAGVGLGEGRSIMHVFSGAMARVTDPMRQVFAQTYLRPSDDEHALALRFAEMAETLMPLVAADLEYLLRMHLRDAARHNAQELAERLSGRVAETTEVAVAFADLVGFTQLGEQIAEVELTDIAERLEALANEHIGPPVRIVKAIGDAVMVVSRDAPALVAAMVDLMDAAGDADDLPPLRTGIAHGRAVARLGDWYGPTVNLAARLTQRARPDSVLVTKAVRDVLPDGERERYSFSEAGMKRMKGISDPVPALRLRRAADDAA